MVRLAKAPSHFPPFEPLDFTSCSTLGTLIKIVETVAEKDNAKASEIVRAEVERLRGETKDPTLEAIQLPGPTAMLWSPRYAVYKPA